MGRTTLRYGARQWGDATPQGELTKQRQEQVVALMMACMKQDAARGASDSDMETLSMDLDGDGFLSMYELEYFYEEQLQRMEQLQLESWWVSFCS